MKKDRVLPLRRISWRRFRDLRRFEFRISHLGVTLQHVQPATCASLPCVCVAIGLCVHLCEGGKQER